MQLPPDLKHALRTMPPGASLIQTPDGAVEVYFKLPVTRDAWKGAPIGYGQMEIHTLEPEGTLIRLVYQVFDQGRVVTPLTLDAFLNPSSPRDRALLEAMAAPAMTRLTIHAFGDGPALPYLGSKLLPWREAQRAGPVAALQATQDTYTDWPAAKERYVREHPLP